MHYQPPASRPSSTSRRCARGEHCGNANIRQDGTREPEWALADLPYCHRCASAIGRALSAMPERYVWLRVHIGDKAGGARGDKVRGSREAPTPLRLDVDALIRDMVTVLVSWEERVADLASLDRPETWLSRRRRDEVAIPAAVAVLTPRLDMVLQLAPVVMNRVIPLRTGKPRPGSKTTPEILAGYHQPAGVVREAAGEVVINTELAGVDAGREFMHLAYMSRRLLGETTPPPEMLDGIPCKSCDKLSLIVCPEPIYRSECTECGDLLTRGEYTDWVKLYSAWARRQVEYGDLAPHDLPAYQRIAA